MSRGLNSTGAHRQNRSLILRLILQNPCISRSQLANLIQLTPASVSNITSALIEEGWVQEIGVIDGIQSIGRRSIGLTIRNGRYFHFAIHMQRHIVTVALGHLDGSIVAETNFPLTVNPDPFALVREVQNVIDTMVVQYQPSTVIGIGVGTMGIVDTDRGVIYAAPAYGWENVAWGDLLAENTSLPVVIDNNARGMALSETLFGHNTGVSWLVFVYTGEGTGVGVLADGKIYRGGRGIGGELGHITIDWKGEPCWCGNKGCLETYLSKSHIESLLNPHPGEDLRQALERLHGQPVYFELIDLVASALVGVVNMFNPEVIVVGGWLDLVWPSVASGVSESIKSRTRYWNEPPTQITQSSFGKDAGVRGASAIGLGRWVYGTSHPVQLTPEPGHFREVSGRPRRT